LPPEKKDFEREMNNLDGEIKRLEAEYNMYLTGRQPRQPFETRKRVDGLVKKFDRQYIQNTADRFRFLTIQTRYAKLCELWERLLNSHDFGKPKRGATFSSAPVREPPAEEKPAAGARKAPEPKEPETERLVHEASFKDPDAEGGRIKELYERLSAARKEAGEAPLAFDRVAALVKAQVEKYSSDGTEVAFRVAMKDGKVSLTVKPVKDED
jgi:hypothetical protein